MAEMVDERRRHELYLELGRVLGQDKATTLMELLPPVPVSELVTKTFLRAELAELRGEVAGVRGDLLGEIGLLRGEMAKNTRTIVFAMIAVMAANASVTIAAINLVLP